MSTAIPTTRRAFRRTDDYTPGAPKSKLVTEDLALPLAATQVLIKVHAVAINYRDANIANGGNPWPVIPHGIPCNDAAGEVIDRGEQVRFLNIGDKVAPIIDTENLTGQESTRSWLAADEDGVLADYIIFDERMLCRLPNYLDWTQASIIPCAGVTAWTAMQDFGIGKSVLIQGMYHCTLRIHVLTTDRYWRRKHVRPETRPCGWAEDLLDFVQRQETQGRQ
jgi:NADPH:quinone reductase-like Zn-dependent oxidoreductase